MTWFLLLATIWVAVPTGAFCEPLKKGRVLCEGVGCKSHDVPTGSLRELAEDFTDRVKQRIKIAKETAPAPDKISAVKKDRGPRGKIRTIESATTTTTNLPGYYAGIDRAGFEASEKVVYVPKSSDPRLKGLKSGDIVWAVVEQEIVASPGVPTPVRAMAISGSFKGSFFLGEATLDRELKRILFAFTKLRLKDRDAVYSVKAAGLSPHGSMGLEGEYVSQAGKFFIAELASAAAAGFVDSTINRNQTGLGTYVQEPSLANSGKAAAVTALSKTTERTAEAARNAPEYTRIPGYQEIQVIIQDDPVENGS